MTDRKHGPLPDRKYFFVLLATKSCHSSSRTWSSTRSSSTVRGRNIPRSLSEGSPTTWGYAARPSGEVWGGWKD